MVTLLCLFAVMATAAPVRQSEGGDLWLDLEIAIRTGELDTVKRLTTGSFDLDSFDPEDIWERTPVLLAAKYDQPEILRYLLDAGANREQPEAAGRSPLLIAIKEGSKESSRVLIDHGANLEAVDSQDRTPLFWAIADDDVAMVEALLEAGADPNARWTHPMSGDRHTLLGLARERDNLNHRSEILQLLEKHGARPEKEE